MAIETLDWNEAIANGVRTARKDGAARGTALCVGSFDGPHLGHKAIFRTLAAGAKMRGLVPGVLTFRKSVAGFKSAHYTGDISTLEDRLKCFEEYGMKFAVVVDFSAQFARIQGGEFFETLVSKLGARFFAEGEDFHCGQGGVFGKHEIEAFCAQHGVECAFVPPIMANGERVSSSRIRQALANGDEKTARAMLGA